MKDLDYSNYMRMMREWLGGAKLNLNEVVKIADRLGMKQE